MALGAGLVGGIAVQVGGVLNGAAIWIIQMLFPSRMA
jgi:hypothetical protein